MTSSENDAYMGVCDSLSDLRENLDTLHRITTNAITDYARAMERLDRLRRAMNEEKSNA